MSDCRYNVFIVYLRILDSLQGLPGKSRHAHCLTVCEKTRSHHEIQPRIRGKRDVKLPWYQIFWISTIFLEEDVHLHCRTIEEKYGLPFCSWVQSCTGNSYMSIFSFFSPILAEPGPFVEIQKCCYHIWQRDVTTSPLYWQCFEDFLGGGASSVDCTYGLATKRYWTQHFNGKFLVLIRFPVISRWHMWVVYT